MIATTSTAPGTLQPVRQRRTQPQLLSVWRVGSNPSRGKAERKQVICRFVRSENPTNFSGEAASLVAATQRVAPPWIDRTVVCVLLRGRPEKSYSRSYCVI